MNNGIVIYKCFINECWLILKIFVNCKCVVWNVVLLEVIGNIIIFNIVNILLIKFKKCIELLYIILDGEFVEMVFCNVCGFL